MPRNTSDEIARQLRRAEALELKVKGRLTMRAIAKQLGVSPFTVHSDIHKAVEEELQDLPDLIKTHREVETQRLDEWQSKVMCSLDTADDTDAVAKLVGVALKISERRARLLGLDAPVKQEIEAIVSNAEATPSRAREIMQSQFSSNATPDKLAQADADDTEPDDDSAD